MPSKCEQCGKADAGFCSVWGFFCSPQEWAAGKCDGQVLKEKKKKNKRVYTLKDKKPSKAKKQPKKRTTKAKKKKEPTEEELYKLAAINCYQNMANL